MQVKLSIVICTHLSDIQTGVLDSKTVNNKLNFVKWLSVRNSDLKADIDADHQWEEFTKTRFFKA